MLISYGVFLSVVFVLILASRCSKGMAKDADLECDKSGKFLTIPSSVTLFCTRCRK